MKRGVLAAACIAIALLALLAWQVYANLFRVVEPTFADDTERFLFGNIGAEIDAGSPKYLWEAAPEVCADLAPGGYPSFGFTWVEGRDIPVGLGEKIIGFPRISFNCATCHYGTVRTSPDSKPMIVPAMSPTKVDFQAYVQFLFTCMPSDRFNADAVMAVVEKKHELTWFQSLLYRYLLIPKTKEYVANLAEQNAWQATRPKFGPGRYDCPNTLRKTYGGDPTKDDLIGNSDLPPIWTQNKRKGHAGLWDGSSHNLRGRNRIAAMLTGAKVYSINEDEMRWIEEWTGTLEPPKFPFPIDDALAAKGKPLFDQHCATCHVARAGTVAAYDEIGTDRERCETLDEPTLAAMNNYQIGNTKVDGFVRQHGYLTPLLDGTWARAPYLHNGSVPNLRALLSPPDQRPKQFYRGYDVYDPKDVGFISSGPDAEREGFLIDTTKRGESNAGHVFGTELTEDEKSALIEYLKKT
jgi:hypothetical protein